jgi:hypothetical protein
MMESVDAERLQRERIAWQRDPDNPYLFHASALGLELRLRINDCPEEVMFTLMAGEGVIAEFDDQPPRWTLPRRDA